VVVIGSSTEEYLFHFAEMQSVLVVRPELHEAHVTRLGQLRYAFYAWEKSIKKIKSNTIKGGSFYVIFVDFFMHRLCSWYLYHRRSYFHK